MFFSCTAIYRLWFAVAGDDLNDDIWTCFFFGAGIDTLTLSILLHIFQFVFKFDVNLFKFYLFQ